MDRSSVWPRCVYYTCAFTLQSQFTLWRHELESSYNTNHGVYISVERDGARRAIVAASRHCCKSDKVIRLSKKIVLLVLQLRRRSSKTGKMKVCQRERNFQAL